jgi:hypothetical protein
MPKVKAKKRNVERGSATNKRNGPSSPNTVASTQKTQQAVVDERGARKPGASEYQALIMPALVMSGCLVLAVSYIGFTNDPNRFLFGGIALLMALMWAFSFWLRLRRIRQR